MKGILFTQRASTQCAYPVAGSCESLRVCGQPAAKRSPYCARHGALTHRAPTPEERRIADLRAAKPDRDPRAGLRP